MPSLKAQGWPCTKFGVEQVLVNVGCQPDGKEEGQAGGWTDGRMDDGWMNSWVDGWICG